MPVLSIDPALDKLQAATLFPEKLKLANEMLKTAKLPPRRPAA